VFIATGIAPMILTAVTLLALPETPLRLGSQARVLCAVLIGAVLGTAS
jgi:hypothetical protein